MLNDASLARQRRNSFVGKLEFCKDNFLGSFKNLSTISSVGVISFEFVIFTGLCLFYLTFSNRNITLGYTVNKLEAEKRQLTIKNEMANRLVEEAKALNNVRTYSEGKMFADYHTYYVEPIQNKVALNEVK